MERFDRAAWKSMQQTMNESSKFVDIMHNVPWEDGLSKDIVAGKSSLHICATIRYGVTRVLIVQYM